LTNAKRSGTSERRSPPGQIPNEFRPADVKALGIERAGVFLPKHRGGENPGGEMEFFVQVDRARASEERACVSR
jgi:hypothetical protein